MLFYQNQYRIPSARAAWWQYGWAGAYFITICTRKRDHLFGRIRDGNLQLSHAGLLADVFWHEIPNHARNVELGAFVVMPNHIHGILILNHPAPIGDNTVPVETRHALSLPADRVDISGNSGLIYDCNDEGEKTRQETRHALSLQNAEPAPGKTIAQSRFQNQGKNTISSIIGGYKAAVTKHARRLQLPCGWQARFHDHIIRNDAEYQKINDYIETNVQNWSKDRFYEP